MSVSGRDITVVVRGAGDLATGVVQKLWRTGFQVVILEKPRPTAIRRTVALSTAMDRGVFQVEDMTARRVTGAAECLALWSRGELPLLADPDCHCLAEIRPQILVDAIIAKRNLGTRRDMAPLTVALGPGFCAPEDVDVVIETMRGHYLGRQITRGEAISDTAEPGELGGLTIERVVHAPRAGVVRHNRQIGDRVAAGEIIFYLESPDQSGQPLGVGTRCAGVLRGLIAEGLCVPAGMKCADVDPRPPDEVDCHSISDKARCLGGAVLEACLQYAEKYR